MRLFSAFILPLLSTPAVWASKKLSNPLYDGLIPNDREGWTFPELQNFDCSVEAFTYPVQNPGKVIGFPKRSRATDWTSSSRPVLTVPLKLSCFNLSGYIDEYGISDESKTPLAIISSVLMSKSEVQSFHIVNLQSGFAINPDEFSDFIEHSTNLLELSLPFWSFHKTHLHKAKRLQSALLNNNSIEYLKLTRPTLRLLQSIAERKTPLKKLSLLELDFTLYNDRIQPVEYIRQALIKNHSSLQTLEIDNGPYPLGIESLYIIISTMENLTRLSISIDSEIALQQFFQCKFTSKKLQSLTITFKSDFKNTDPFAEFLLAHLSITELNVDGGSKWTWMDSLPPASLNLISFPSVNAFMLPHLPTFLLAAPKVSSLRFGQNNRHSGPTDDLIDFLKNNVTVKDLIWGGPINDKFVAAMLKNTRFETLKLTCSGRYVTQEQIDRLKSRYPNLIHPTPIQSQPKHQLSLNKDTGRRSTFY